MSNDHQEVHAGMKAAEITESSKFFSSKIQTTEMETPSQDPSA